VEFKLFEASKFQCISDKSNRLNIIDSLVWETFTNHDFNGRRKHYILRACFISCFIRFKRQRTSSYSFLHLLASLTEVLHP